MRSELTGLKILRLCGALQISNALLTCILTEIPALADLSVEMRDIDATHVIKLLTPGTESVLVPRLQALRLTEFMCEDETLTAFFTMLQARFRGISGAEFTLLRLFTLWGRKKNTTLSASLTTLKEREGWDIRIDEEYMGDFWKEDMDCAFL
ncbi:hypothetical protein FB451DRAFT_1248681 [Mycena latifolia]|nr:hypothetical protein FB451DRAFT_1248681 [Mycena latifolia]